MKAREREIRRKKRVLDHAVESGNVAKTCRPFSIAIKMLGQGPMSLDIGIKHSP